MSVETLVEEKGIYFVTFTCYKWMPLFDEGDGYNACYKFFEALRRLGHTLTGYVIMPNHLHMLLHYIPSGASLNKIIGNGKRFMAYHIIKELNRQNKNHLLQIMSSNVSYSDKKRGKLHEAWQPSFDVKVCRTEKFLLQKLNYIHANPVTGKWKLAASGIDYPHSSAAFYLRNKQSACNLVHYEQLLDWENMYN